MDHKGVALVTGAARGIGRAIALRLAEDGFDVTLNDLESSEEHLKTLAQEITQKGRRASVIYGDVSQETDVRSMVDSAVHKLGSLNVMVANAGISSQVTPIQDVKVEEWDRILGVNIRGVFFCYKYAAQQMIKQGRGGRIIGASSITGKQGEGQAAPYSASKFAVRGLTQSAAKDLGVHKITVNAYAPGATSTPMLDSVVENMDGGAAFREAWIKATPVGYIGMPSDIASIVSYIASKEAHFITGQTISVNGGMYFD
ncbi:hypothetical protein BDZ94DRAFT_1324513 [Collybia nuda]|uniref:Acetoin reductase family protein n=1 Tax=Collybia nuda TaxID=64659 RepID=A0A9P6CGA0_9AGAR|nr:hypothetical protein BDZ94DRAFT_1324513 [Collybia nuda]